MAFVQAALALFVSAAFASGRAVVPAGPVALPSLAQLAPILSASVPGLASSLPALPASSLNLEKAQILLDRAAALPYAGPGRVTIPAGGLAPAKAIESVNAVLKGITPERLSAMSDEDLNAAGGLILDAMQGVGPRADAAAVGALARAALGRIESLKGLALVERSLYKPVGDRHEEEIEIDGVPEGVRLVDAASLGPLRHYTTADGLDGILKTGSLLNGFVSYVQRSTGLWRKSFSDLRGVFLTAPSVKGFAVGVPEQSFPNFVDVLLPPGIPLLEIEPGHIYMIPLPSQTRGWLVDVYRRWSSGAKIEVMYENFTLSLDKDGGPGPKIPVPVTVVASGKVR